MAHHRGHEHGEHRSTEQEIEDALAGELRDDPAPHGGGSQDHRRRADHRHDHENRSDEEYFESDREDHEDRLRVQERDEHFEARRADADGDDDPDGDPNTPD